jgi:3-phosphoshikimate 1-carboxyvinyltransferase
MAFAVAGLRADSPVTIDDADCVAISFPEFFTLLDHLSQD